METELKPCPKCGETPIFMSDTGYFPIDPDKDPGGPHKAIELVSLSCCGSYLRGNIKQMGNESVYDMLTRVWNKRK